ncbi:PREDICTED: uncharacterized protein LOC104799366 isoform X3 [Tarenaya hassleriana]|uniref:uncharacterized protein LOC104799366 isoform X3 n=1 Tax=Tarenaya hassleriana TaxID=28532 RepID=UPI00053C2A4B|nr:PREDICTED: uncharacterized protein LOC104799366 isoform X3 [Tarenaya hassleriana]
MSGNQETPVRPSSWLCSDLNAGIPIKKRKFFVRPLSPPAEEAYSAPSENSCKPNEQGGGGGSGNTGSISCSLDVNPNIEKTLAHEKVGTRVTAVVTDQKTIDRSILSTEGQHRLFQSDLMGNVGKTEKPGNVTGAHEVFGSAKEKMTAADAEDIAQGIVDQSKVKTKVDLPGSLVSFTDVERKEQLVKPSGSGIVSSSMQYFSSEKLTIEGKLIESESSGLVFSSGEIGKGVYQNVLTTRSMIEETCDKKNVSAGCQADLSPGSCTANLSLGCKTDNSIYRGQKDESLALNLTLSKEFCSPHKTDGISVSTDPGRCNGINRSNWDLNTTMDAWEDEDCTSVGKTNLSFLISESTPRHDDKASSSFDETASTKSVSEEQEKRNVGLKSDVVASMLSDHQDSSRCSLSLGLSSYASIEKSPLLVSTTQTGSACTSFSWPMMAAGNVNSVSLRIVKSEHLDEVVTHETESTNICPVELSSDNAKQELVGNCQRAVSSSGFSKLVNPTPIKVEPNYCNQSEAVNRKDGKANQADTLTMQCNDMLDLPTISTSNQKEKQMPFPSGYRKVPVPLTGMTETPGDLNYSECSLHENSAQSSTEAHGILHKKLQHAQTNNMISPSFGLADNNCDVSVATVASLTEDKTVGDCKTSRSKELPLNSRRTDENSLSDEEKINLSGDMLEEELYDSDFESDGGHDLSKLKKNQDNKINEDGKVQGSAAAVVSEDNPPAKKSKMEHAKCSDSETKTMDIAVVFRGDFQNSSHIDNRGSESASRGKTVDMPSSEDEIKRLIPEFQGKALDDSGEKEGQIIQDGGRSSYQVIHASEGVSGASTVSSVNIQNPEIIDRSSTASYGADISSGDPPKEFSRGGSHSRIINLARISDKSSAKILDASGSFGPSQVESERFSDLPLESRKFFSRGSRDEVFNDHSYRFSRERYHNHFGNQRLNFMPGRWRFSDRTEFKPRDRGSENFEFDNYGNTREDGAFVRSFRRGRRTWNDQGTFFPHSFSRRQSPGNSFTHRGPRNSDDASAFHGRRDGEKFSRGLPRNDIDLMARPQRPYEDLDGRFVRGQRNFSTNHKRAFPQFRSRSPTRTRARSPGPCSSSRNRSPDGFAGNPDFPCRRSSPSYSVERMRSPDHSGFPRDMAVRRHGSPSYSARPSNGLREMGSVRGRGFHRSGISFRNQPDRVFRNHGKFNIMDSRERVEYGDNMFDGPSHSDRFGEFGVNVNAERRRFGDRHDGIRPFRPSFNTGDCGPTNIENDPDSMRFGQEDAAETEERGNIREYDRQNKNFAENTFERARNFEKEESSRHGGELWQDGEFGDAEQVKKKGCQ